MAGHATTDSDGATVGETTPAIAAMLTQARIEIETARTAAMAAVARIVIAVKAVSALRPAAVKAAVRVVAEVAGMAVARAIAHPNVAVIVKDRAARGARNRAHALIRVHVAIRMAGLTRAAALSKVGVSIRARDRTRPRAIRVRVQRPVPALSRRVGSTVHAVTKMAAPIKVDGSMRVAMNRSVKTVGRTKALCATTSAIALQRALVPTPTATALVVVIDQIAAVANAVAAEDVVEADAAVVAAGAKAGIVRDQRRAEHPWALVRRLPGQKTRLLRKPPLCRRVTVPIAMKTSSMRNRVTIRLPKRLGSGSRTIVRLHRRSSGRRNRSTRRRNPSTGRQCLRHNM